MLSKNMYENELIASGLSEKQAKIYIACVELGSTSVPEIARRAGIKRTTAYGVLDELVSMGLVNQSFKKKKKLFVAQEPQQIISLLKDRQRKIEEILPELSSLYANHSIRPKIIFFEGRDGLRKIYDDMLGCHSKEVRQIVRAKDHALVVGEEFVKKYISERVARGITAYVLHPKSGDVYTSDRGRENVKLKRFVRYLPPSAFYAAMIMIYDHKVAMVSTKKENFGFIIESREFANTLTAYFDLMWGLGSKTPEV